MYFEIVGARSNVCTTGPLLHIVRGVVKAVEEGDAAAAGSDTSKLRPAVYSRTGALKSVFRLFVEFVLNNQTGVSYCPGRRSRTPSDTSGPSGGHPSHPQDPAAPPLTTASRRHLKPSACGTAAGDNHMSPPTNPAGHSTPRVCAPGGKGPKMLVLRVDVMKTKLYPKPCS